MKEPHRRVDKLGNIRTAVVLGILVVGFLLVHRLLDYFFGVGTGALDLYRNRFTQKCVFRTGYEPPWFSIIYKYDFTCSGTEYIKR